MQNLWNAASRRLLGHNRQMRSAASSNLKEESDMADKNVTLVLPAGGTRTADVPDDVPVHELLPELVSVLDLPTVGPDGRPMGYRVDSKALGRELAENE